MIYVTCQEGDNRLTLLRDNIEVWHLQKSMAWAAKDELIYATATGICEVLSKLLTEIEPEQAPTGPHGEE